MPECPNQKEDVSLQEALMSDPITYPTVKPTHQDGTSAKMPLAVGTRQFKNSDSKLFSTPDSSQKSSKSS